MHISSFNTIHILMVFPLRIGIGAIKVLNEIIYLKSILNDYQYRDTLLIFIVLTTAKIDKPSLQWFRLKSKILPFH